MKYAWFSLIAICALIGCGEPIKTATITGRVTDSDGLPVRDARVFTVDASTTTTSNGTFVLNQNRDDYLTVFAEYRTPGGTLYKGQNVARSVANQNQVSVNVTVFPSTQLARVRGTIKDRDGFLLSGASVFAYADGYLSSARAVTDSFGNYIMEGLVAGVPYDFSAGGQGYGNDETSLTLGTGETRILNFVLDDPGFPTLPAPANLSHIAWVSPRQTRSNGQQEAAAYENIKRLFDPSRATRLSSRASTLGAPIEVELNWDRLQGVDFYGYGVYRGTGATGSILDYDLYREPMAGTYIDGDPNLRPDTTYRYQLTALGTRYPDDPDSEGPRSAIVVANTLDDLLANTPVVSGTDVTFSWAGGSGATSYVVYVFDQFPGLGVTSIYNNQSAPTTNNSLTVSGTGRFVRGRTYYTIILGLANSNRSRTISQIGQFVY